MKWKELKHKKWFRILSNKYLLISLLFLIWMLFFDSNSWLVHRELNAHIEKLKQDIDYYQKEIAHDKALIKNLDELEEVKEYAREHYFMKRPEEEIFIITYKDSLKAQSNE